MQSNQAFELGMLHLWAAGSGAWFSQGIQAFGTEGWDGPSGFSSFGTIFPCSAPDRHLKENPFQLCWLFHIKITKLLWD